MRPIVLSLCLVATACGQVSNSPTAPTAAASQATSAASTVLSPQAQGGTRLPFHGSFTGDSVGAVNCPPTCPPTTLTLTIHLAGQATHLGAFTVTGHDVVDLAAARSKGGTYTFIAANGDQLFTSTTGGEDRFTPPNISHVTLDATIVGGTGRFASATGRFSMEFTQTIDETTATASMSGSFEGRVDMNR
jgi:hypothetical protein